MADYTAANAMPSVIKKANPAELLASVTEAVTKGKSVQQAGQAAGLSVASSKTLEAAIQMPIEEFREKTKAKLMKMSDKMLNQIDDRMDEIPASGWAFTYTAIRDSISSMDSKTAPGAANVNIQVNNYGTDAGAKNALIDALHGIMPAKQAAPVIEVVSAPHAAVEKKN